MIWIDLGDLGLHLMIFDGDFMGNLVVIFGDYMTHSRWD